MTLTFTVPAGIIRATSLSLEAALPGIKIGVSTGIPPAPPAHKIDPAIFARHAERLGFESMWVGEHAVAPVHVQSVSPVFPGGQVPGFPDPLVALSRASAVTTKILLGTSILLIPEHHPLALAKGAATLDLFSGGRLLLGIGVGWLKEERVMMGGDADRPWAQTREAVRILKDLWTKDQVQFHGEFYDFPPVQCFPKPARKPHPPVLVGGLSRFVLKRVVDYGDGWLPHRITPEKLKEQCAELRDLARAAGRDPDKLSVTVTTGEASRDLVARYADAGATRVVVNVPIFTAERQTAEGLERIAAAVLR